MAEEQTTRNHGPGSRLLDASAFAPRGRRRAPRDVRGLHICPCCESPLVYPVDWAQAERQRWRVDLRCPDCEWRGGGIYRQELVDRFDEELDAGTEQLLSDLHMLTRANMEEQVARFVAALRAGQLLPEDF